MAIEEHILANILAASIKSISGKEYGSMVLEVADADECARALAYLAKEPYVQKHVWEKIEVERMNVVIGRP